MDWLVKGTVRAVLGSEQRGFGLYMYTQDGVEVAQLLSDPDTILFLTDREQRAFVSIIAGGSLARASFVTSKKTLAQREAEVEAFAKRAEREKWGPDDKRWMEGPALSPEESLSLGVDVAMYSLKGRGHAGSFVLDPFQLVMDTPLHPFTTYIHPGGLHLRDRDGKSRLRLALSGDGSPALELRDKGAQPRAVLGRVDVERTKTGALEQRAESSLVLFDKDGKVIWQTP